MIKIFVRCQRVAELTTKAHGPEELGQCGSVSRGGSYQVA